ncbi:RsmD family RNA methyltransferase [Candidatus Bathyarchaeota archaeon]|nr:RsmD family RNA methyltransferase [Candidatus Bathyarchaeota archaeon]
MVRLFFLLSGEHETLPTAELKAILEAEDYNYKILEELDQVLRIEADLKCAEAVKNRAALTRTCALELFTCEAKQSEAVKALHSTNISEFLEKGESFAVRIKHVKSHAREVDGMALERKLGEIILNKAENVKVNLKNPQKTFTGILTDNKLVFGLKLADVPSKSFMERYPKKKPFFHPSAMPPKLARCMVNLAKPKVGDLVLDPFCGTGSILIEAALIGCRVLGMDIQRRMVKGSQKNLAYFGIEQEGLIVADAKNPPTRTVDAVVADPPYGRSATTFRRTTKQIIEDCLKAVHDILSDRKRICMAAPKTIEISQIGKTLGYRHMESHFVYVHRSLTREIAIFERV